MEWDTAAGQAVLLGAGGRVVRFDDHAPLAYGKRGFENPFFIACAPGVELAERLSARGGPPRHPGALRLDPLPGQAAGRAARRHRRGAQPDPAQLGGRARGARASTGSWSPPTTTASPTPPAAFGAEVAMTPETCRNGTERCAVVAARARRRLRHRRQPAGRRAADPALVRLGADRGDAGRPGARGGDPGAALRRRRRSPASSRTAATAGSAPPPRSSTGRAGRSTSPRRCIPYTGRPLGAGRGDPGLPPRRRLRLPPRGARRLRRLAGRAARDLGGARAAALHGERRRRCTASRSRRAAAPSGSSTTRRDVPRIEAILRELGLP